MGIPRKGSRRVDVDGKEFRYLVREDGSAYDEENNPHPESVLVTVQEDDDRPGRVLQWKWPYGASVMPEDIRGAVRLAMERGWVPSERGGPFLLGDTP